MELKMRTVPILIISISLPISAYAGLDADIEPDAIFPHGESMKMLQLINPSVGMIRAKGWKCDSISAMSPSFSGHGYTVKCNNFKYTYEFQDRGGSWTVYLK
jgi:hypothetical protein